MDNFCVEPNQKITTVSLLSWLADRLNNKSELAERKLLFEVGLTGKLGRYPTLAIIFLDKDPTEEEFDQIEEEITELSTDLITQSSIIEFTEFLDRENRDWNQITDDLYSMYEET